MKIPTSPCLDCVERVVGCHGKCESYATFRNEYEAWRTQERKRIDGEAVYGSFVKKSRDKAIKRTGKRVRAVGIEGRGGRK